jgi:hypothetical protein
MEESVVNREEQDYRLLSLLVRFEMTAALGGPRVREEVVTPALLREFATLLSSTNVEQVVLNLQTLTNLLRDRRSDYILRRGDRGFIETAILEGKGTVTIEEAEQHLRLYRRFSTRY